MSVQNQRKRLLCEVQIVPSKLDRILAFLGGVISMGVIALIVGVVFLETNGVTIPALGVAGLALVSLLLLRDIPIQEIKVGDYFHVKFTMEEFEDENGQTDKGPNE